MKLVRIIYLFLVPALVLLTVGLSGNDRIVVGTSRLAVAWFALWWPLHLIGTLEKRRSDHRSLWDVFQPALISLLIPVGFAVLLYADTVVPLRRWMITVGVFHALLVVIGLAFGRSRLYLDLYKR